MHRLTAYLLALVVLLSPPGLSFAQQSGGNETVSLEETVGMQPTL